MAVVIGVSDVSRSGAVALLLAKIYNRVGVKLDVVHEGMARLLHGCLFILQIRQ